MRKVWKIEEEKELKSLMGCKIPVSDISVAIGRTEWAVINKARKLGCMYNYGVGKGNATRRYDLNHDFFSQLSEENCYWAGLIAADGCVQSKSNCVILGLDRKDDEHLLKLKDSLGYTGPLTYPANMSRLSFYSSKIKKDLNSYFNIIPQKSNILGPPSLHVLGDERLVKAYIIGYIDGDGHIALHSGKYLRLQICGSMHFLTFVKSFFDKNYPSRSHRYVNVTLGHGCFMYSSMGERMSNILHDLLLSAVPFLPRKWNAVRSSTC